MDTNYITPTPGHKTVPECWCRWNSICHCGYYYTVIKTTVGQGCTKYGDIHVWMGRRSLIFRSWKAKANNWPVRQADKKQYFVITKCKSIIFFIIWARSVCSYLIFTAVASNRPTGALASVISFTFVVYSHYKHS